MRRTGQTHALVVAALATVTHRDGRACTSTTWTEGPITVLPHADVVVVRSLPSSLEADAVEIIVRWDVLARICGTRCLQLVDELDPPRWITRRWPTPAELDALHGLALRTP